MSEDVITNPVAAMAAAPSTAVARVPDPDARVTGQGLVARVGRILASLCLGIALGGIACGLLGRWSPELDVSSHFMGHWIGLALSAHAALLIRRHAVFVLALGSLLTLTAHAALAVWPQLAPASIGAASGETLRVVSLNTWHFNREPERLSRVIGELEPDILILIEAGPDKVELLRRLAGRYPYQASCASRWACSMAILSRRPFNGSGVIERSVRGGPIRVWIRFGEGSDALTVMAAHLLRPIDGPVAHLNELAQLAFDVHRVDGTLVLAGDFNSTPWSHAFTSFLDQSGLRHMGRLLPTWPSGRHGLPQLAIDHMFTTGDVEFESVSIGPDAGSDHRPLVASLRLPRPWASY